MNADYFVRDALLIGGLARKTLVDGISGTVLGSTSKGLFLTTGQRILFITSADYKSPFNIQLFSLRNISDQIIPGDGWTYGDEYLVFSERSTRIATKNTEVWQPSFPPTIETNLQEQQNRIQTLFQRITRLDPSKGWLFLTSTLDQTPGSEYSIIQDMTERFITYVSNSDLDGAIEAGKSILGRGGGLTPSGDDWLSGFLLFYARIGIQNEFIHHLGQALTALAFESTTMISANRIEAACQGWSEELFLGVVDSLLVDDAQVSDLTIERLVNFGHSSGVDTCVGIGAALTVERLVNP